MSLDTVQILCDLIGIPSVNPMGRNLSGPEFLEAVRNFPQDDEGRYEHEFGWLEMEVQGRPLFLLSHMIADEQDDYALFFLREYYVSNTLDFLTVLTIMLPDGDNTFVGVLTQTSTEKVAGAARPVAAPIGRTIMAYNLRPLFESMQKRLGAQGSSK